MALSDSCGHHCGIVLSGLTHKHEGHCECVECHNGPIVMIAEK